MLNEAMSNQERILTIAQIAAGIAHEIGNPLTSISGLTNILKEKCSNNQELYELADMIFREAGQMRQIVDDLVRIAQPVSPKLKLENFEKMVLNVMARAEKQSRERYAGRIKFTVHKQEGFPARFYFDPKQMQLVVETLTSNAVDAVTNSVNFSRGTIKYILKYLPAENQIRFDVSDTGCGLSREELKKVSIPFFTTKPNGKGLSLSYSVMIVNNHGGRIEVESEKKKGTTFSVYLPIK